MFVETVKQDTPRLVVLFKNEGGAEQFSWGIVGNVPMMSLIGAIIAAQTDLATFKGAYPPSRVCLEPALVIAWDGSCDFKWFVHPSIPLYSLLGMLETIKAMLAGAQLSQMAAAQQTGLVAPSGRPIQKRPILTM